MSMHVASRFGASGAAITSNSSRAGPAARLVTGICPLSDHSAAASRIALASTARHPCLSGFVGQFLIGQRPVHVEHDRLEGLDGLEQARRQLRLAWAPNALGAEWTDQRCALERERWQGGRELSQALGQRQCE